MIFENTICDDRLVRVDEFDVRHYAWGSGVICCDACASIVSARESWMEVYA